MAIGWLSGGAAVRVTKRTVDTLKPGAAKRYVYDDDLKGFGLVVQPGGTKTYIVEYRPGAGGRGAQKKRVSIGRHGSPWTPTMARQRAEEILHAVEAGADPAAERADERKGPDPDQAFEAVARRFLDKHGRTLRPSTRNDYRKIVERRLIPAWGQRRVGDITRKDVTALVTRVEDDAPVMARLVFAVVRKLFNWTVERGLRDDNPADGLRGPAAPKARDRVLDDDEVRVFWRATEALGAPFVHAFRLLLLTAARRDEVGGLMWSELDLAAARWRLPAERAKNDTGHEIDLAPLASAEIEALDEDTARHLRDQAENHRRGEPLTDAERQRYGRRTLGPFVFGARGTSPLSGWSKAKRRLDDEMVRLRRDEAEPRRVGDPLTDDDRKAYEPAPWRLHDLRRTAATGMAAAGFAPQVVERVLNHKSGVRGGLVGVYQRYEYRDERRAASWAWASHVAALVGEAVAGGNVVALRPPAG